MKIFYDPTEAREGTRLTSGVVQAGQSLPGLEHATGADLLVSPLDIHLDELDGSLPADMALRAHCESGALIQRKSGMDLIGSIPKLESIQVRMQEWSTQVWLLVVGSFYCTSDGKLTVDHYKTDFSYNSVMGALNWWQLRGGSLIQVCSEVHVGAWIKLLVESLVKVAEHKERVVTPKPVLQRLLSDGWWEDDTKKAARMTLETFPGMGPHRADLVAEQYGNLGLCIAALTDVREWERMPKGIGGKTLELARLWLGMTDGVCLETVGMSNEEFKECHSRFVKGYRY